MNERYHRTIAIDLGTMYSSVAAMDRHACEARVFGIPEALNGSRSMPSAVELHEHAGRLLIGHLAKCCRVFDPDNTIVEIKREMGGLFTQESLSRFGAEGIYHVGDPVRVKMADRWYLPQEISALILMKLKEVAETEMGTPVLDAVVTVPACFTDKQLKATCEAALLAGLYPRELIQEPTAAAMSFGVQALDNKPRLYLVYNLGGGTFDVSIIEVSSTGIQVLATSGEPRLGGVDFDERITEWALKEIRTKHGMDLSEDPCARASIRLRAERAKIELSERGVVPLSLADVVSPAIDATLALDRSTFEMLIAPHLDRTEERVEEAIEQAAEKGVHREDIHAVLLAGGSTKIPAVRRRLVEHFGRGEDFVRSDADPATAAVTGAAHVALRYAPSDPPFDIHRCDETVSGSESAAGALAVNGVTSQTLGVEVAGGICVPIIPVGTSLPVSGTVGEITNADESGAVHLRIYRGEDHRCENNEFLGIVPIENIEPLPPGTHRFDVTYSLDRSGILSMSVYHKNTNATHQVSLQHAARSGGPEALSVMRSELLRRYETQGLDLAAVPGSAPLTNVLEARKAVVLDATLGTAEQAGIAEHLRETLRSMSPEEREELLEELRKSAEEREEMLNKFKENVRTAPLEYRLTNPLRVQEDVFAWSRPETIEFKVQEQVPLPTARVSYTARPAGPTTSRDGGAREREDGRVHLSAYCPSEVGPNRRHTLLVYLHEQRARARVLSEARAHFGEHMNNVMQNVAQAQVPIESGNRVVVLPWLEGCSFHPRRAVVTWLGRGHCSVEFSFSVLESVARQAKPGSLLEGAVSVWAGPVFIGDVPLTTYYIPGEYVSESDDEDPECRLTSSPVPQRVFLSYSSADSDIVGCIKSTLTAVGNSCLRDTRLLVGGDSWGPKIEKAINSADVFELCWSDAARASRNVKKEWRYALGLKKPRFIRGAYWQKPMPALPRQLRHIHFAYIDWFERYARERE